MRRTHWTSFTDVLAYWAERSPDKTLYRFLRNGQNAEYAITYGQLLQRTWAIAAVLREQCERGERVILMYEPGLAFIEAFFACMAAGVIPVPVYPLSRKKRSRDIFCSILQSARPALIATSSNLLSRYTDDELIAVLPHLATDQVSHDGVSSRAGARPIGVSSTDADDLAFLQYTSGSTGKPKGVMVTHGNLLANNEMIRRSFGNHTDTVGVSWLPLYHDMGLIGNVLQPLYIGGSCVFMSPLSFLRRPMTWLRAIMDHGGTDCGGPNFAYEHCVQRIRDDEVGELDLSSWTLAYCGAEPVRHETLDRFARKFAPSGFSPSAFYPCYGLAEATLLVTGGHRDRTPTQQSFDSAALRQRRTVPVADGEANAHTLVSCGGPAADIDIKIVDPQTRTRCREGEAGEIWLRGPSIAAGYMRAPELMAQTFFAELAHTDGAPDGAPHSAPHGEHDSESADDAAQTYLRTGDIGFLHRGELYICGREKDLIIIRGVNHYPQDIEHTAERCSPSLRPGCCAAFALETGAAEPEGLAIVLEYKPLTKADQDPQALLADIKRAILDAHEVMPHLIALVRPNCVPKTSSGKLQRAATRELFVAGELPVIAFYRDGTTSQPHAAPEQNPADVESNANANSNTGSDAVIFAQTVKRRVATLLKLPPDTVDDELTPSRSLLSLGVDSLKAMELLYALEAEYQLSFDLAQVIDGMTVGELLRGIQQNPPSLNDCEDADQSAEKNAEPPAPSATPGTGQGSRDDGVTPLSPGQRALYFLHQLDPQSAAYNLSYAARITGPLDRERLRAALELVWRRHSMLRATISTFTGDIGPIYRIGDGDLPLYIEDGHGQPVSNFNDSGDLASLDGRLNALANAPFDLARGPLFRVHVLQSAADEHLLLLSVHHIVADYWSLTIIVDELLCSYDPSRRRPTSAPQASSMPYAAFAAEQAAFVQSDRYREQLQCWTDRLGKGVANLQLITDKARPAEKASIGRHARFQTSPALGDALTQLAQAEGVTLFTLLFCAFHAFLYRHTGQGEIAVGTPTAGRTQRGLEHTVGYFVNTIPVVSEPSADLSFRDFLRQFRKTLADSMRLRQVPLAAIVEAVQPERDLSRSPLFDVLFSFQSYRRDDVELLGFATADQAQRLSVGGLSIVPYPLSQTVAQFDLNLMLGQTASGLSGLWQYDEALFSRERVQRFSAHFTNLLQSIIEGPDTPLSQLSLLDAEERHRILVDWNRFDSADVEFPGMHGGFHAAFEAQAAQHDDRVAVVFADQERSYGELDRQANQLAHWLRQRGTPPGALVGVCMERSCDLLAVLLAVLKAGCAYVPLDPQYPQKRLRYIADHARLAAVIVDGPHADLAAALWPLSSDGADRDVVNVVNIDVDRDRPHWQTMATTRPAVDIAANDLAYVIYTSGSTGQPKGVTVRHHSVSNFFAGMDERIGCDTSDTLLAVTSISFDISVLELFWPLARGTKVVLIASDQLSTAGPVARPIAGNAVDFGLFYFGNHAPGQHRDCDRDRGIYRLLMEGARFADTHEFSSVWTPERHFHEFGGRFPNPALTSAALAAITERVAIRSGSVVLPLHQPLRAAEDWSVIDNLSQGRAGISIAAGWQPNDFALAPENFAERKDIMFRHLDTIRQLWRGDAVAVKNGVGDDIEVQLYPRPIQEELPVWVTSAGNPETWRAAGRRGLHVLTHMLGQNIRDLHDNIRVYRQSRAENGFDPDTGTVTLMLHTFVGASADDVREIVRRPFMDYLRTSSGLLKNLLGQAQWIPEGAEVSEADLERTLEHAFQRFFGTSTLFGDIERCQTLVDEVGDIGVDEIACLIDFGVDEDTVLAHLPYLNELRENSQRRARSQSYGLAAQAQRHRATMLQCTPSLMGVLGRDAGRLSALSSLRTLMLGGERLPLELARTVHQALPGCRLVNMYGPTETTIWSSTYEFRGDEELMSIGRPISNTQMYVLDEHGNPVPPGVLGHLYIAGSGLSAGYLHDSARTRERFIANPYGGADSPIMYRTGDLARYRQNGELIYMGRSDHQIKRWGHRIELQEIDAVLGQHGQVAECAVILHRQDDAQQYLVAFVVARVVAHTTDDLDQEVSADTLIAHARTLLPAYMVPDYVRFVDSLPLTPNGKIDRLALERLSLAHGISPSGGGGGPIAEAQTETERLLAELWATLLKLEQVSVDGSFFELGGHSLLAMEMVSNIRERLSVEVPLRALFEHPTVRQLAGYIDAGGHGGSGDRSGRTEEMQSVERVEQIERRGQPQAPLSFQQQRVYFIEQLEPESTAYNMLATVEMNGQVVPEALEQSLAKIIERHESLRTVFVKHDGRDPHGQVHQVIQPLRPFQVPVIDVRYAAEEEREQTLARHVSQYKSSKFDLSRDLLLKATLVRMADDRYVLMLNVHHLASDDWSMNVLLDELVTYYNHLACGAALDLTAPPIQYADYAHWQHECFTGERSAQHLAYWQEKLRAPITPLDFALDNPRPADPYAGDIVSFHASADLIERLTQSARQMDGTLYMLLLSAYKLMLYRYTGQSDIIVGAPIANRPLAETQDLIGFFVNTLALRTTVTGELSFAELFQRVRQTTLEAYEHQDYPFEKLVQAAQIERDLDRHPFFETLFNLVNTKKRRETFNDFEFRRLRLALPDSKFLMTVYIEVCPDGLDFQLVYKRNVLDRARMQAFMSQYHSLLKQLAADVSLAIDGYELRDPHQRRVAQEAHEPQAVPIYESIPQQIARSVAQFPTRLALDAGTGQISYGELDERVNRLAAVLMARGLAPGDHVLIAGQRSVGLIVAMLAVWRSSGVIVPLDTMMAPSRQRAIVEQVRPAAIVRLSEASHQDADALFESATDTIIDLASDTGLVAASHGTPAQGTPAHGVAISAVTTDERCDRQYRHTPGQLDWPSPGPRDAAYIFFTSGTTGTPKGIIGCHGGLAHFITWQRDEFAIAETDRVSHLTAISFDVVLREILLPLASGATLCLPPPERDIRSSDIVDWLADARITIIHTVPTLARTWLQGRRRAADVSSLRWVFFAGEPLSDALVTGWRQFAPGGAVVNLYGPTETTLAKTFDRVPETPIPGTQLIGRALPETQILILNRAGRICGTSEAGEICIRTPFRSLGYLHDDDDGRFLQNPFRRDPDDVVYRTGDLGYWAPDGRLAIAGRIDRQIKIRGVRIEPQEIESALAKHPDVESAVVTAIASDVSPKSGDSVGRGERGDSRATGERELVAYVVPRSLYKRTSSVALRAFVRSRLSRYMIPSVIMFVDALPLSKNGKVELSALPAPVRIAMNGEHAGQAMTGLAGDIAAIWAEVLSVDHIGADDNFFDLGGHSLLMTQVQSRLTERLTIEVPLVELFQHPTVAALAQHLSNRRQAQTHVVRDVGRARALRRKRRMRR